MVYVHAAYLGLCYMSEKESTGSLSAFGSDLISVFLYVQCKLPPAKGDKTNHNNNPLKLQNNYILQK